MSGLPVSGQPAARVLALVHPHVLGRVPARVLSLVLACGLLACGWGVALHMAQ